MAGHSQHSAKLDPERRGASPGRRPRDFPLTHQLELLDAGFTETPRQRQVLDAVALGLENKQIARNLGISEQRTKELVSALLLKFDVRSRAALARAAVNMRLLGLDTQEAVPYSYLFDEAPVLMAVMAGPQHRYVLVNSAYAQAFGNRRYRGHTVRECFPDAPVDMLTGLDRTYAGSERYAGSECLIRYQMPGGGSRVFFLSFITEPIRSAADEITGLVYYGWDVTALVAKRGAGEPSGTDAASIGVHGDPRGSPRC
jgi:DNA-binding CsgD family transcriptional regulator